MDTALKTKLTEKAADVRVGIIEAVYNAKSGHPGGSLSSADILTYLYNNELGVTPENFGDAGHNRFVLSKGHSAPVLYSALANFGFFPVSDLKTLRKPGSHLQGHPCLGKTPGVDMSTGSLGQGISAACGMALSSKVNGRGFRVYALLGDGEIAEGIVWEAALFAAHYKLDNLCAVLDNNGLQIDGSNAEVMGTEPLDEKFAAFGWNVIKADAHDFDSLETAFAEAKTAEGKPSIIIAKSVKGKGVSFMENNAGWHGKAPNDDEYAKALAELKN